MAKSLHGLELRTQVTSIDSGLLRLVAAIHRRFRGRFEECRIEESPRAVQVGRFANQSLANPASHANAWKIAPIPDCLLDRRIELIGSASADALAQGFQSSAQVYVIDFEDQLPSAWSELSRAQARVSAAIERLPAWQSGAVAVPMLRPRALNRVENRILVDGQAVSAGLFDVAAYAVANASALVARACGVFFSLPRLSTPKQAALWNDVFECIETSLSLQKTSIKASICVDNLTGALELDAILSELRNRSCGLQFRRNQYIASVIRSFKDSRAIEVPHDEVFLSAAPFVRSCVLLMRQVCHERGAQAIGGLTSQFDAPSDIDLQSRVLVRMTEDKIREIYEGLDGTAVQHPDLIALVRRIFDHLAARGIRPQVNQAAVAPSALLDVPRSLPRHGGSFQKRIREQIRVVLHHVAFSIETCAEDAEQRDRSEFVDGARADVALHRVWHRAHRALSRSDLQRMDETISALLDEECAAVEACLGRDAFAASGYSEAQGILRDLLEGDEMPPALHDVLDRRLAAH